MPPRIIAAGLAFAFTVHTLECGGVVFGMFKLNCRQCVRILKQLSGKSFSIGLPMFQRAAHRYWCSADNTWSINPVS